MPSRRLLPALLLPLALAGCVREPTRSTPAKPGTVAKTVAGSEEPCPACCCEIDRTKLFVSAGKAAAAPTAGRSWPLFGGSLSRNMVDTVDKSVPTEWAVEEGKRRNIKWVVQLGSKAYGGPVIANGRVYMGTNNTARDPKVKGPRAVIMCFAEADGKFLWQIAHDYPGEIGAEAKGEGMCSTPAIDGNRIYYVTPGCEVVCADAEMGAVLWKLDMMKDLKVMPYHLSNCSPLVAGDLVFVLTGNGVDEEGKITSPKAPSFLAINKGTGKIVWQDNSPGAKILEGQWSNPVYAEVNGKPQIIFPGGDDWLYAFEPATGKRIWKFNVNPGKEAKDDKKTSNYMVATPVVHDNKLYIGLGLYPEHPSPTKYSHFLCIDITKSGDVSAASLDAPPDGKSALVWSYGGAIEPRPKKGRPVRFGRTMSTAAVHDGLVYAAEESGYLHCLDAKTGKQYWEHDFLTAIWGSPLWVDGKVYIGTEDGDIVMFAHGKDKKLIGQVSMEETVHSTPVVVNQVLYVTTRSKLYAIGKK